MRFNVLPSLLFVASARAFSDMDLPGILNSIEKALDVDDSNPDDNPPFNAQKQAVDITGAHAWQAPGSGDARGPCPGLNALANHAYLPRNGIADIVGFTTGTQTVYNMGLDLGAVLAVYGAVFDGALVGWSIGGQEHTGIGGSHNNYETDSSPLRGDLNQYGSNTGLVISQFEELFDMQPDAATANYDLGVLTAFRKTRFEESIAKNPDFTYLPFSGGAVSQAAFAFIYRYFANHTESNTNGVLTQEILMSFMSIQGTKGNFTWVPGNERIPENWYKRGNPYGLQSLSADITTISNAFPPAGVPGCNTGKVNTYTPINTTDLSKGAYSQQDVVANPLCFGLAFANSLPLSIVGDVVGELLIPVSNLLGCHTVPSLNESVFQACPGYSTYGGPTGPIAPGAVQN